MRMPATGLLVCAEQYPNNVIASDTRNTAKHGYIMEHDMYT